MSKLKYCFATLVLVLLSLGIHAQSCASTSRNPWEWPGHNNWYFGNGSFYNFTTNTFSTSAGKTSYEGISAASNDQGNLVFYTNGRNLWDAGGTLKSNALLEGNEGGATGDRGSAAQGVITVRHPLSPNKYYVLTTDDALGATLGLNYVEVDQNGNVTAGPTRLGNFRTTEGITATLHENGVDVWVVVQESGSTNYHAFLLQCTGFNTTPVTSGGGTNVSGNKERGGLALSWDGKKFIQGHPDYWPNSGKEIQLYDFNNKTGQITNGIDISPTGTAESPYDILFSPDNQRIYFSKGGNGQLWTMDISSGNAATIAGTLTNTGVSLGSFAGLAMGADGNLYMSSSGQGFRRITGNINGGTGLSASGQLAQGNLGMPTIYIPPAEEPDIQEVGPFTECDGPVDLHTYWLCSTESAEDTLYDRNNYAGTGITDAKWGTFDPGTAGAGLHEIVFTFCDVDDTIWIQVNPCNSCEASIKDVTPAICPVNTILLDSMVEQSSGTGTWTIDSVPTGAGTAATISVSGTDTSFNASNYNTIAGTYKLKYEVVDGALTCYDTMYVIVHPFPTVNLGNDTTICPESPGVTFDAGAGFTTYSWSINGSGAAQTFGNTTTAGDYAVEVTDANGCKDSDTVALAIFTSPVVDLGNDTSVCPGESVTFDAGTFTSYAWSLNGTGAAQTTPGSTAGNYAVIVTDANGCTDSDTVALSIYVKPVVDLGTDQTVCPGDSFTFDATSFSSYAWSGNGSGTDSVFHAKVAGDYIVDVTDANGCKDTDTVALAIHTAPVVNLGNDVSVCPGDSNEFDAGNFAAYEWSINGSGTAQTFMAKVVGDYAVIVTDANGCKDSDTVALNFHAGSEVNLGNDTSVCPGESVTFDAGAFTSYSWYMDANGNTQTYASTVAGTFAVAVQDANGCSDSDTVVLSIFAKPVVELGPDTAVCPGDTFMFDATSFVSYVWSGNGSGTDSVFHASVAGDYYVVVTDVNNCKDSDTVALTIRVKPDVDLGPDKFVCPGGADQFDAGVFATYEWSGNASGNTQTVPAATKGQYKVIVTDNFGCKDTDSVSLDLYTPPVVDLGKDTSICPGDDYTFDAGNHTSYEWSINGSGTAQTFTGSVAGNYAVVVTDGNGCKDSDTVALNIYNKPVVDLGQDRFICPGDPAVEFDAGSFSSYQWSLSASGTAQTYTSSTAGNFAVVVTDANNCKDSDTVSLSIYAKPVVDLGADRIICAGAANEVFDAGNFTSYQWEMDASGTTKDYSTNTAGDFAVIVTDANGCKDSDTVALQVIPLPTPDVIADVSICPGMNQTFEVNTYDNGNGAFTYSWQDGSTASNINVGTQGWYWVDITDRYGCVGRDSAYLTIKQNLDVTIFSAPEIQLCAGEDTILRTNYNAVDGYNFTWSGLGSGTTETITTSQTSGTYEVRVDNGQGCEGTAQIDIVINPLPTPVPYDTNYCEGSSVNIGLGMGGAYSYAWNNGETTEFITVNSGNLASPYNIVVTNIATGCTATATINVTEHLNPVVNVEDVTVCDGVPVTLQSTNNHVNSTFSWTGGSTDPSLSPTVGGSYTLTVTSDKGCVGSDAATVVFNPIPLVDLGPDTVTICEGESHTFDAGNAGKDILWNNAATTSTVTGTASFNYIVTVTDAGCSARDTAQLIVVPLPTSEIDQSLAAQKYCFPELDRGIAVVANSNQSYEYAWNTGETLNEISVTQPGTYSVTISAGNCSIQDEITFKEYCPWTLFIPNAITPNGDGLNDFFNAKGTNLIDYKLLIFDRWGEKIFETNSLNHHWDGKYMGNVVQIDVYVWKAYYSYEDETGTIVKDQMVGTVTVLR